MMKCFTPLLQQRVLPGSRALVLASCLISLLFIGMTPVSAAPEVRATHPDDESIVRVVADVWEGDTNADGTGLLFEVFRMLFEGAGMSMTYQIAPFRRAIAIMHQSNKADVLLADWNREHLTEGGQYQMNQILFPRHALSMDRVVAVFPPGSSLTWEQVIGAKGMKLAWVRGYNYHQHLSLDQHQITRISNTRQGLKMLFQRRVDAYLDAVKEVDLVLAAPEFLGAKLPRELVLMYKLYPIFRAGKRGKKLMAIYDKRMAELIQSGELFQFYRDRGEDYRDVLAAEVGVAPLSKK